MKHAQSRFRTLAIAATAAAATVIASGFVPGRSADAQRRGRLGQCLQQLQQLQQKDYRLQRVRTRANNYKAAYQELQATMMRMENLASRRIADYRTRRKIMRMGANARQRAASYLGRRSAQVQPQPPPVVVAPPPTVVTPPPAPPANYGPNPISRGGFRRFHTAVRRASFDRDRVALVRDMSRRVSFNARQITALMRVCSFDKSRVDIAAALHRNVVDPQNWFQVYGALSFSSSKKKLRRRIRRHR